MTIDQLIARLYAMKRTGEELNGDVEVVVEVGGFRMDVRDVRFVSYANQSMRAHLQLDAGPGTGD